MKKKFHIHISKLLNGYFIAFVGLMFMAIGIWRDEVTVVCTKAIQICLECIGIG